MRSFGFMAPTLYFLLSPLSILPLTTLFISPSSSSIGDENWITAVRKGTILYERLQSGCFPESANPITVADLLAGEWDFLPRWPPPRESLDGFTDFVADTFGWTDGKDYYYEEVYGKSLYPFKRLRTGVARLLIGQSVASLLPFRLA